MRINLCAGLFSRLAGLGRIKMSMLKRFWRYSRALFTGKVDTCRHPLQTAAFNGDTKAIELLLKAGADINAGEPPPLHLAVFAGRANAVRVLLEHGACTDKPGLQEALAFASRTGRLEVIELLATAGIKRDPNIDCIAKDKPSGGQHK